MSKLQFEVRRTLDFLRKLLWRHAVVQLDWTNSDDAKSLNGPRSAWIVDFGADDSQDVTIVLAKAA